ncbi:MAG TPA: hypothetical protein DCG57_07900 [Candidatus Riflebacteria bacterium]|jgi:uncharacterized protein (DUF2132 family)|nr:hypothetical protein [Candidatus Riflebacteria bacterium]
MSNKKTVADKDADKQLKDPLHGVTLAKILTVLREHYSWKELNRQVELNCFFSHPSIKSSLTFLRKHEWARKKVEALYLELIASLPTAGADHDADLNADESEKAPDTSNT